MSAAFVQSPMFPLYDKITAENIVPSMQSLFKQLNKELDVLEASTAESWETLVNPYEEIQDRMNVAWGAVSNLQVRRPCICFWQYSFAALHHHAVLKAPSTLQQVCHDKCQRGPHKRFPVVMHHDRHDRVIACMAFDTYYECIPL